MVGPVINTAGDRTPAARASAAISPSRPAITRSPATPACSTRIAASRGFTLAGIPGGMTAAYYLSAAISGLSSLLYLLLVRRGQTRAEFRASAAMVELVAAPVSA